MTRAQAIAAMRVAGYHEDRAAWTRLYVEQRVSFEKAQRAWREGAELRMTGVTDTRRGPTLNRLTTETRWYTRCAWQNLRRVERI